MSDSTAARRSALVGKWRKTVPTHDAGALRDRLGGRDDALGREHGEGGVELTRPVAERVAARGLWSRFMRVLTKRSLHSVCSEAESTLRF